MDLTGDYDWVRASIHASVKEKEWNYWDMTQFIIEFLVDGHVINAYMIRLQRHLENNESKEIFIDISKPKIPFDKMHIKFWNRGTKKVELKNLVVTSFKER